MNSPEDNVRTIIRDRLAMGQMPESVADFLSLPPERIIEVWEEVKADYMAKFRGNEESLLSEFLLRYERLLEEAWFTYAGAQDETARIRALELAMRILGYMSKLMQDMGMLQRRPTEIKVSTIMERVETYQVQLMRKAEQIPELKGVLESLEEEDREDPLEVEGGMDEGGDEV